MSSEYLSLDLPRAQAVPSYIEALQEGYYMGIQPVKTPEEIAEIKADPAAHLQSLNEQKTGTFETPDGTVTNFVPYETLWLMQGDTFIGSVSFRHVLNEVLENFGGHIGYGIRPSYVGKGYATQALYLTRKKAFSMGIDRLLLTCSPENPASEKVIVKNGGEFIDISYKTYGYKMLTKRYWVHTKT